MYFKVDYTLILVPKFPTPSNTGHIWGIWIFLLIHLYVNDMGVRIENDESENDESENDESENDESENDESENDESENDESGQRWSCCAREVGYNNRTCRCGDLRVQARQ
ncbi:hypothetical protein B0H66DRAFT_630612 [Apodospora peruviana]|uniref:Uncharacterized protein n=1 Tax=Apodospora peruviana TaxID=516989 RepID=A0AAE0HWQ8_9PEZI|nr:hypothetical protein B0H66DRAFT_630612 [Apodospora peruviana]